MKLSERRSLIHSTLTFCKARICFFRRYEDALPAGRTSENEYLPMGNAKPPVPPFRHIPTWGVWPGAAALPRLFNSTSGTVAPSIVPSTVHNRKAGIHPKPVVREARKFYQKKGTTIQKILWCRSR